MIPMKPSPSKDQPTHHQPTAAESTQPGVAPLVQNKAQPHKGKELGQEEFAGDQLPNNERASEELAAEELAAEELAAEELAAEELAEAELVEAELVAGGLAEAGFVDLADSKELVETGCQPSDTQVQHPRSGPRRWRSRLRFSFRRPAHPTGLVAQPGQGEFSQNPSPGIPLDGLHLPEETLVRADENIIFFPTYAHFDEPTGFWNVMVHGWVFGGEVNSRLRSLSVRLFCRVLGITPEQATSEMFRLRSRGFLVRSNRGRQLAVRLGTRLIMLERSAGSGHFRGLARLTSLELTDVLGVQAEASQFRPGDLRPSNLRPGDLRPGDLRPGDLGGSGLPGQLFCEALTRRNDDRRFAGRIHLIPQHGVSVISDIDDTIKHSDVANRRRLLANTFLHRFHPIPGMAQLYQSWAQQGASFHYVSASPWQLFEPLAEFLAAAGFPLGTFHLKMFRWKNTGVLKLFASPKSLKRRAIRQILTSFPYRKFLFVGDSGQRDPEIYGSLGRLFPSQFAGVMIRNITQETPSNRRMQRAFRDLPPSSWCLFEDPSDLLHGPGAHLWIPNFND